MVDPELLEILVCPETRSPLRVADDALLHVVNQAITEKRLHTREGAVVKERIEAGLIREDGKVLYPIREGIPIMLVEEAVQLEALS